MEPGEASDQSSVLRPLRRRDTADAARLYRAQICAYLDVGAVMSQGRCGEAGVMHAARAQTRMHPAPRPTRCKFARHTHASAPSVATAEGHHGGRAPALHAIARAPRRRQAYVLPMGPCLQAIYASAGLVAQALLTCGPSRSNADTRYALRLDWSTLFGFT